MARKPKVFVFSDGFHAWTVATTSRAKAIEAWGLERDPFEIGAAEEVEKGPDYDAALKAPGQVIKRGLSVDVGEVKRQPRAPKKKTPSRAERERVRKLEAEVEALAETQAADRAELEHRRQALDKEAATLEGAQAKAREAREKKQKTARAKLKA